MFKKFTEDGSPYIIAEVGQNHQGDLETAREFIKIFAAEGANAIKFQTRNNKYLFAKEAYEKNYDSENAFSATYGAHREKLELDVKHLPTLKEDCKKYGVDFMSTPFDEPSIEVLKGVGIDIIKVASFDLGNLPLIKKMANVGCPIVISIGGGKIDQIRSSIEVLLAAKSEVALLHCVSEYPCEFNRLGLENVATLINEFPECTIGSSDHFNGTLSGPVAYMQGARVFEKHVTLNRAWKGTDHSFALEPHGFRNFVRDINRVRHMLPLKPADDLGNEYVFQKLGKSLVPNRDIAAGEVISIDDLSGKIFNDQYIPVRESNKVIGLIAKQDLVAGEYLTYSHFESK